MKPKNVIVITDIPNVPPKTFEYQINPVLILNELVFDICTKINLKDSDNYSIFLNGLPITPTTLQTIPEKSTISLSLALDFAARQAFDQLQKASNAEVLKRVLFFMRQKITLTMFVSEFTRLGGIGLILEKIMKYEGNVQSYGLTILRSAMSFDSGMNEVVKNEKIIRFLFSMIDEGVIASVCRQSLELLFVAIHYGGFNIMWKIVKERAKDRDELPLANVVKLLKSGDIETVGNSLTLLYGILHVAPQEKKYGIRTKLKYQGVHKIVEELKSGGSKKELKEQITLLEKYFYGDDVRKEKKSLAKMIKKEQDRMKRVKNENTSKKRTIEIIKKEIETIQVKIPILNDELELMKQQANSLEKEIEPLKEHVLRKNILKLMKNMTDDEIKKEWVKYKVLVESVEKEKIALNSQIEEMKEKHLKIINSSFGNSTLSLNKNSPRGKVRMTKFLETRRTINRKPSDNQHFRKPELPPQHNIIRIPWRRILFTPNPKKPTIWDDIKILHVREKQLQTSFLTSVSVTNISFILDPSKLIALSVLFAKQPNESKFFEAFTHMYSKTFDTKTFELVKKIIPTEAEAFQLFSSKTLNIPETLLKRLALAKNLPTKIAIWSQVTVLEKRLDEVNEKISCIETAVKVLKKSFGFKEVLTIITSYNHQLNLFDSNKGFDLTCLLKLKDLKTNTNETLLDCIISNLSNIKILLREFNECKPAILVELKEQLDMTHSLIDELNNLKDIMKELAEDDLNIASSEVGRVKNKALEILEMGERTQSSFYSLVSWCMGTTEHLDYFDTKIFFGLISTFHAHLLMSKALIKINAYEQMKKMRMTRGNCLSENETNLMVEIIDKIRSGEIGRQMLKKTTSN
ncbi:hypothetical protein ENUP19_0134G0010 [Entamoeba nuttalli]|uniref:Formin 2 family protein n=2 Tax=Entamoeba nuttalli TaxID=412467 RepID=K2H4J9_ENTNP|nr:formin 2 family protein [Entamoeba nuttalli P19]EKE41232.1 formin 2 family protein [Entamoeba nuttalli P19]|eukprot:XP_008856432.1 formin 2 family protein [Entamoeba nuttalli P19]